MLVCSKCHKPTTAENSICYQKRITAAGTLKQYFYCNPCFHSYTSAYQRDYYQKHKQKLIAKVLKRRKANPEIQRARTHLQNARRRGKIIKPATCHYGCQSKRIEAHHTDYSKPLDVIWLCPYHHRQQHKKTTS